MQLISHAPDGRSRRLALRRAGRLLDLTGATGATDVGELLASGMTRDRLHELPDGAEIEHEPAALAPIARPGKIICVGLNSRGYAGGSIDCSRQWSW